MKKDFKNLVRQYFQEQFIKQFFSYLPYIWLILFICIPFAIILKISFAKNILSLPPVSNLISHVDESVISLTINFKNYISIFTDSFYRDALSSSISLALTSTFFTLIFGYLMAYGIYKTNRKYHYIFLMLVMVPFWISFLIRVYAWMNVLSTQGVINQFLIYTGMIKEPMHLLDSSFAVCLGIVYCYLPFMILPIYTALEKIDYAFQEAAYDLGATPWKVFWYITVPLSYNGIFSGCLLVFMPAIGEFVIPELLGGSETFTIGRVVWLEFFTSRDWPMASALAIIMIIPILGITLIGNRYNIKKN